MPTFDTSTGHTVEAIRMGIETELVVRNAAGATIATVRMHAEDARGLLAELAEVA